MQAADPEESAAPEPHGGRISAHDPTRCFTCSGVRTPGPVEAARKALEDHPAWNNDTVRMMSSVMRDVSDDLVRVLLVDRCVRVLRAIHVGAKLSSIARDSYAMGDLAAADPVDAFREWIAQRTAGVSS